MFSPPRLGGDSNEAIRTLSAGVFSANDLDDLHQHARGSIMSDILSTTFHHFPQGNCRDELPTQAMFDHEFLGALAELPAWPVLESSNSEISALFGPCGFIALATATVLACAPDPAAGDSLARDTDHLLPGIRAVIRAVLAQRARILAVSPTCALGKDVTPALHLGAMVGQWEMADAISELFSSGKARVCYLRNTFSPDDTFFRAFDSDPPWVHEYFALAKSPQWGVGCKHFMQDGAQLLPLHIWAAQLIASAATFSPPFVVDTLGHYFVSRVDLVAFRVFVFDSIAHEAGEPLNDQVLAVARALKEACLAGRK